MPTVPESDPELTTLAPIDSTTEETEMPCQPCQHRINSRNIRKTDRKPNARTNRKPNARTNRKPNARTNRKPNARTDRKHNFFDDDDYYNIDNMKYKCADGCSGMFHIYMYDGRECCDVYSPESFIKLVCNGDGS
ncbi:hypothetical protein WR25_24229 [Diploscapter pachys]|uniref:Uncharacterized protein n=1 Tax=Diploscapter pachys TaxID=2018661 RepID=A0A2A2LQR0_9BILA|nr:hypothetical protein WR25_24229 [Diploscapter pachys]